MKSKKTVPGILRKFCFENDGFTSQANPFTRKVNSWFQATYNRLQAGLRDIMEERNFQNKLSMQGEGKISFQ